MKNSVSISNCNHTTFKYVRIISSRLRIGMTQTCRSISTTPVGRKDYLYLVVKKIIFVYQYLLTCKQEKCSFWGVFGHVWDPRNSRVQMDPPTDVRIHKLGEIKSQAIYMSGCFFWYKPEDTEGDEGGVNDVH